MGRGAPVVQALRELERPFDVLARGLPVTLAPVAAGAPAQDVGTKEIAGESRALGEPERLVEQTHRRRDAGQLVPAHAQAEEDLGAVHVGKDLHLRELARRLQQLNGLAHLAALDACPGLTAQRAQLDLGRACPPKSRPHLLELGDRLVVTICLRERLGTGQSCLDPAPLGRGDAARQERTVDAQPLGEPVDRLGRRASLAALDLADVLLGEAPGGELRLCHPRRDAQPPQPLPEGIGAGGGAGRARFANLRRCGARRGRVHGFTQVVHLPRRIPWKGQSPQPSLVK